MHLNSPRLLGLFCESEKSHKIPIKYPAGFPCKTLKMFTNKLLLARRENTYWLTDFLIYWLADYFRLSDAWGACVWQASPYSVKARKWMHTHAVGLQLASIFGLYALLPLRWSYWTNSETSCDRFGLIQNMMFQPTRPNNTLLLQHLVLHLFLLFVVDCTTRQQKL